MQVELRVVHACRALGALWWALAEHRLQEGHCRRETVRRVLGQAVVMAERRGGCEQLPGGAVWFVERIAMRRPKRHVEHLPCRAPCRAHRHAAPKAAPKAQHLPMLIGAAAQ